MNSMQRTPIHQDLIKLVYDKALATTPSQPIREHQDQAAYDQGDIELRQLQLKQRIYHMQWEAKS